MARGLVLCLALLLAVTAPALAEPSKQAQSAIRNVIEQQMDAFQRDDGDAAFSYASPMIKQKFDGPAAFMEMVRQGYRPVYRPQAVEFRNLEQADGRLAQHVYVVGPDGRTVIAVYLMDQQDDGTWKIDGVYLEQAPDETV
jgi:ketosteroid isomerase-like protein